MNKYLKSLWKEFEELRYWKRMRSLEGELSNAHYPFFYMGHFGLEHFDVGHFDVRYIEVGHFVMSHFDVGHFWMGHIGLGHFGTP